MGNRESVFSVVLILATACLTAVPAGGAVPASRPAATPAPLPDANPPLGPYEWDLEPFQPGQGCSTVYATDGQQMLGGNNEDSIEPLTKVWFVPATEDTFGLVFFGYSNYRAQGGMNDQGLFFDFQTGPRSLPVPLEGKQPYPGVNFIVYDAMARCATVACVVEMFEKYYDRESLPYQHLFGDATGESAIIEPQTILRQRDGYQVATNFYQSAVAPEERDQACPRFKTASEMLEDAPALSVEFMRDVMAAVHQHQRQVRTVYTNVYDLVNRKVYVYYFSDYEHVVVLDLEEELAKGAHSYDLAALFPANTAAQQFFAPALRGYDSVIRSRQVEVDPAILAAYVGEYAPPQSEPRAPGEWVSVLPYGSSLMMVFPDSHRYELFPQSETSFFVVTWNKANARFEVQFDVEFGLDEATGQVLYMDWVFGPGDNYVRNDRLNLASYVPAIPSPVPTATPRPSRTPRPTATTEPTPMPTATSLPTATPQPSATAGPTATSLPTVTDPPTARPEPTPAEAPALRWVWAVAPVVLLAVVAGWVAVRRRRAARR